MPIIDIQRRLREVGRIRLGEQVPTSNGKIRPAKLSKFRFTSADEVAIKAVAAMYGGEPQPWEGASVGEQFELYAESRDLEVLVPPVDLAWSQWMENWSGAVCRNRCDGQVDIKNDAPCSCDPDAPICKPTSRLGVILTGVDGIGIWRTETHGWHAAQELNGSIEVLRAIQNRGVMVPARLILDQRQQKKINEKTGKVETFNYPVPVLDLKLPVAALVGTSAPAPAALPTAVTPIEQTADAPLSIAEQAALVAAPVERQKRANSAPSVPATGMKPRGQTKPKATEKPPDINENGVPVNRFRRLMALTGKMGDDGRKDWATVILERENNPVKSFNDLTANDVERLIEAASVPDQPRTKQYAPDDDERPF